MKPRKLLANDVLSVIWLRYRGGVPVRKLRRDFDVEITLPTFKRLIEWYEDSTDVEQAASITDTIKNSLFPAWLKEDCRTIQSQPQDWKYIGRFPLGQWIEVDNEDT